MAKKKRISGIQTRWTLKPLVHRKVAAYKAIHGLDSMETAANILLDKLADVKLPE